MVDIFAFSTDLYSIRKQGRGLEHSISQDGIVSSGCAVTEVVTDLGFFVEMKFESLRFG